MIPIRTSQPSFTRPVATLALIVANVAVFLLSMSGDEASFVRAQFAYGFVPERVAGDPLVDYLFVDATPVAVVTRRGARDSEPRFVMLVPELEGTPFARALARTPTSALDGPPFEVRFNQTARVYQFRRRVLHIPQTVVVAPVRARPPSTVSAFTSMFLHGGWLHLLGNLWFLWLFGPAVEDVFGRARYLVLYFGSGIAAAAAHVVDDPGSLIPCVGASGAISGAMGAYLLLFPRATVLAIGPILLGGLIPLPAFVFLGFYLLEQVFMSLRYSDLSGGVAWWAHIGGFVAGLLLAKLLPPVPEWRDVFRRRRPSNHRRFGYDYD
jgi:membrane associated rhomboid family serine protease